MKQTELPELSQKTFQQTTLLYEIILYISKTLKPLNTGRAFFLLILLRRLLQVQQKSLESSL